MLFRFEPAKQASSARWKVLRALCIDEELRRAEAAVSESDGVHAGRGETAVKDLRLCLGRPGRLEHSTARDRRFPYRPTRSLCQSEKEMKTLLATPVD